MKRVSLFGLLMAMGAMSLVACGNEVPPAQEEEQSQEEQQVEGEAVCGDGVWQKDEECDGKLGLAGKTCGDNATGSVKCTACKLDYSDCQGTMSLATDYVGDFHYDLSGVAPSQTEDISAILKDPANELADLALDTVVEKAGIPSMVASLVTPLIKPMIYDALTDYVGYVDANTDARVPAVKTASEALDAVTGMINDFNVISTMALTIDGSSMKFVETWESIAFDWSYNCQENCKKYIAVGDMGLTDNDYDLQSTYAINFFADHDQLVIGSRSFTMDYGTIVNYLYKNEVIPAITGDKNATSSEALLNYIVKPEDLAQTICDKDNLGEDENGETIWGDDGDHDNWNSGIELMSSDVKIPKSVFVTAIKAATKAGGEKMDELVAGLDIGEAHLTTEEFTFTTADNDHDWTVDELKLGENDKISGKVGVADEAEVNMDVTGSASQAN